MTITSCHNNKNCRSLAHPSFAISLALIFTFILLPQLATAATEAKPEQLSLEDARWFQVELILFAQKSGDPLEAEQWPDLEGLTLPDTLLELHLPPVDTPSAELDEDETIATTEPPNDATSANEEDAEPPADPSSALPEPYQILGEHALQLTDMANKIKRSSKYKSLLHIAWQQPTYDRQHAQPIFFMEGMDDPLPIVPSEDITAENATTSGEPPLENIAPGAINESPLPPLLEYATEEDTKIGPPNPQFAGTVTLSVERYLHLATDLEYRQSVTQHSAIQIPDLDLWYDRPYPTLHEPQGPAYRTETWQAMRGFKLKESRRMRSKEIHYLDHPFMGMVVVITPVELPEEEEEIQQTSPQNILSTPGKR